MRRFLPLILALAVVFGYTAFIEASTGWNAHRAMIVFMGSYLCLFGLLKIFNWKKFVVSYRRYDDVAKRSIAYAWAYPAIELSLGLLFLFSTEIYLASVITMCLMTEKAYSVAKKLAQGGEISCACMGGLFDIPVTRITLAEDAAMALMAAMMVGAYLH
jgi:hypothetical protein